MLFIFTSFLGIISDFWPMFFHVFSLGWLDSHLWLLHFLGYPPLSGSNCNNQPASWWLVSIWLANAPVHITFIPCRGLHNFYPLFSGTRKNKLLYSTSQYTIGVQTPPYPINVPPLLLPHSMIPSLWSLSLTGTTPACQEVEAEANLAQGLGGATGGV